MARTEGNRPEPRKRSAAKPAPKRPNLPTVDDVQESSGLGRRVLYGGVGLVALALLIALAVGLANQEPLDVGLPTDFSVDVSGDRLTPFSPEVVPDPSLGQPIPEITSVDFEGEATTISHDGRPKVILFLAHWCPHCQREVPALQTYIEENGVPEGVDFVSVATSINAAQPNYPPNAWLEREGWTQRVVMDDPGSSISVAYGLLSFPYYVLVDGDGNVVQRITGEQSPETVGLFMEALAEQG